MASIPVSTSPGANIPLLPGPEPTLLLEGPKVVAPVKETPLLEGPVAPLLLEGPKLPTAGGTRLKTTASSLLALTFDPSPAAKAARITANIAELVKIRSQGGIDDPKAICKAILKQLEAAGLPGTLLTDEKGRPVGVTSEIVGGRPGPSYALDAVVDTAPVGDLGSWKKDPFAAEISDGRMHGRGTADSKAAAAIFIELGRELQAKQASLSGKAILFFDAAEHTGEFQGVKAFLAKYPKLDGVMIGYPGDHELNIGSRGFLRSFVSAELAAPGDPAAIAAAIAAPPSRPLPQDKTEAFPHPPKLTVTAISAETKPLEAAPRQHLALKIIGTAAHSGSSKNGGVNAIQKAGLVLEALAAAGATVTGIKGGVGFAQIPDLVELRVAFPSKEPKEIEAAVQKILTEVDAKLPAAAPSQIAESKASSEASTQVRSVKLNVDVRTTPVFGEAEARAHLEKALAEAKKRGDLDVGVSEMAPWPAFGLAKDNPLRAAMEAAITQTKGAAVPSVISGPSNVGNLLASYGIPATTGFGVAFTGMHAANESIDLSSIPGVLEAYRGTMERLLGS